MGVGAVGMVCVMGVGMACCAEELVCSGYGGGVWSGVVWVKDDDDYDLHDTSAPITPSCVTNTNALTLTTSTWTSTTTSTTLGQHKVPDFAVCVARV
jgi:hypothetical protein